jgi:hypothetical protein
VRSETVRIYSEIGDYFLTGLRRLPGEKGQPRKPVAPEGEGAKNAKKRGPKTSEKYPRMHTDYADFG